MSVQEKIICNKSKLSRRLPHSFEIPFSHLFEQMSLQPNYAFFQLPTLGKIDRETKYAIKFCQTQNAPETFPAYSSWRTCGQSYIPLRGGWKTIARPRPSGSPPQFPHSPSGVPSPPRPINWSFNFAGPPPSGACIMQLTSDWFHFRNYLTDSDYAPKNAPLLCIQLQWEKFICLPKQIW